MSKQKKLKKIINFYDRFAAILLSNTEEHPESVQLKVRSLLILWSSTTFVMWLYVLYCFLAFGFHYPMPWGGLIFTLIHTITPVIFYLTQSYAISGLVISLSGLGFQTLFCIYSGGVYSPAAIWLTLHPVILGFFGNTRLIIFSVVLNFTIVLSLYFGGLLGHLPLDILPPTFRDIMIISSYVGLDILVAVFTIVAIRVHTAKNKELYKSRELTENLLRILCHDISTPLTIIKNSSNHLTIAEIENNPNHVERIKKACEDMISLTGSLGSWMAYKDEKICFNPKRVAIEEIILHLEFSFEDKLKAKNIVMNFDYPESELAFLGDKMAITYQIFNNIISNAIKFSYENSQIDISFGIEGHFVVSKIRDHGVGINEKIIAKVFSPYERTTSTGTKNERGTGFGMPIVATVVGKMNGKISVENISTHNPNERGTLITVKLPKA